MKTCNQILILNLGSTTVKGSIFVFASSQMNLIHSFSKKLSEINSIREYLFLQMKDPSQFLAIAFRVVHGGVNYPKPTIIGQGILSGIVEGEKLAPLHNSVMIKWYLEIKKNFSNEILMIACYDSSFFYELPKISKIYPISPKIGEKFKIEKFGFHGFAHQSMLSQLKDKNKGKVITMQLGGGCSITASVNGQPIETSMGFSPLEGLMMGTRSGSIDPGIIFYLLKKGMKADEIEGLLNHDSGLKGMIGTDDMQSIMEIKTEHSIFALNLFCRNIAKYIGSYLALLGGIDVLVFGGGIGENNAIIRNQVITYFNYMGIHIDEKLNQTRIQTIQKINSEKSSAEIYIIKPDEEFEIVKQVQLLLKENNYYGSI